MSRPRKPIDWPNVDKLCALQATELEISQFLDISVDTLCRASKREHGVSFAEYFAQKRGLGRISLRRSQWQAAQGGNPTMLIWLGKQYLDQRDKNSFEHSGPDGRPIEMSAASLTDEQLDARIKALSADDVVKGE